MSIPTRGLIALATLVFIVIAGTATAQIPDEFTNLEILPKDINKRELINVMRQFAGALGVRCNYCHVGDDPSDFTGYDFASDDKESKRVARAMMTMTSDINNSHIGKLEGERSTRVRCITCHSGVQEPETIDNIVFAAAEKDGVEQASAKYRELREEYYGQAAYDFSAGPLNTVAEKLAQEKGDVAGAIEIMKMNIELNPDQAFSYIFLGQLYQASGDKDAAIASIEKALELDPGNRWAQGMLEKMKAAE